MMRMMVKQFGFIRINAFLAEIADEYGFTSGENFYYDLSEAYDKLNDTIRGCQGK